MVEASRKHGPFDTRWPCARNESASQTAPLGTEEAAEALDWRAFSNRYFPGRRRHDMEALTAYAKYTQGREWRTAPARLSVVPPEDAPAAPEHEREEAGAQRLLAAIAVNQMNGGGSRA